MPPSVLNETPFFPPVISDNPNFFKSRCMKKIIVILGSFLWMTAAAVQAEQESIFWGADLSLGASHQEFANASADLNRVDLAPYVGLGNWQVSLQLPWLQSDGDYFTNGQLPRVVNLCNWVTGLSDARIQRLINRGRLTQNQVDGCETLVDEMAEAEASRSGMGDIGVQANYGFNLSEHWWLGAGLGYSHDNGDYEKGLGKGSRNLDMQLSLGGEINRWQPSLMLGYVWVDATETAELVDNYALASAGLGYKFTDWLTLGVDYRVEQSYVVDEADIKQWQLYSNLRFGEQWYLHAYWSQYAEEPGYPESEMGASLTFSF